MRAEREAFRAVVLDHFPARRHRWQGNNGLTKLWPRPFLNPVGGGKEWHRIIAQRLDRPGGIAAAHLERTKGVGPRKPLKRRDRHAGPAPQLLH